MASNLLPGITVFTPTYNRAHLLGRLYESLVKQNCNGLEWLVVDDGSTDDTEQTVAAFAAEGKVNIRYIRKENGGKHTALNVGIREASRTYFVCVDSDDFLASDAVLQLMTCIDTYAPDGIIAYKKEYPSGKRIGKDFPEGLEQTTLVELINNYDCAGDRTLVYKTELLRPIQIPEPPGQRFFPETYLYDRFDEHYACRLLGRELCECEYLQGGYSDSFRNLMIRNALSMKWFFAERIDMPVKRSVRFDAAYRYIAFACMAHSRLGRYRGKRRLLLVAALPTGLAMFARYSYHKMRMK